MRLPLRFVLLAAARARRLHARRPQSLAAALAVRRRAAPRSSLALRVPRGGFGLAAPLIDGYRAALATAPLCTNVATAACLAMTSDAVAQSLGPTDGGWDAPRTAWIAVWGGAVSGYMLQYWFKWLRLLFPLYKTSNLSLVGKVFVNQLVMSPGLNAGFFAFVILTRDAPVLRMPRAKRAAFAQKIKADLPSTVARSCVYWSIVQTFNFRLLPESYTVFVTNAAYLVWTTYLSVIANLKRGDVSH